MINNVSDTEASAGYGVPQPSLATKDIVIIVFMFLLWGYSLLLTYRAWYRILYLDGDVEVFIYFEYVLLVRQVCSRFLMDVIKSKPKDDEQTPSSSLNVLNQIDNSSFVDIDPNPPLFNARPAVV